MYVYIYKQGLTYISSILFFFKPGSGPKRLANIRLMSVDFSCANSILNVRQRRQANGEEEEMVYQTERDAMNGTDGLVNLSSTLVTFSFHAPRRSCRINIHSKAVSSTRNG